MPIVSELALEAGGGEAMMRDELMPRSALLNSSDPHPVREYGRKIGVCRSLLVGDHAGSMIPATLGDLGLSVADQRRHIAVDLGVEKLGRDLTERLDGLFLSQVYSRLVVDYNRWVGYQHWVVGESEGTAGTGPRKLE